MFITSRASFNPPIGPDVGEQRIRDTREQAIEIGVVMAMRTPPGDDIDAVVWNARVAEVRTALEGDNYFSPQGENWAIVIGQPSED